MLIVAVGKLGATRVQVLSCPKSRSSSPLRRRGADGAPQTCKQSRCDVRFGEGAGVGWTAETGAKLNGRFCAHWSFGMTQSGRLRPFRFWTENWKSGRRC